MGRGPGGSERGTGPSWGGDDREVSSNEEKWGEESIPERGESICEGRPQHLESGGKEKCVFMMKGWQEWRQERRMEAGLWRAPKSQTQGLGLYPSTDHQFS